MEQKGIEIEQRETTQISEKDPVNFSEVEPTTAYNVKWRTLVAIFALSLCNATTALTTTSNTTIRFQVLDLGDASLASWIANSGLLVTLAFGPILGSLSDRFGKKWFIVVATAIGCVGSIVSGSAHKTSTIVIGQILTGFANAGGIIGIPAGHEVTPNKFRPFTMAFSQGLASFMVIAGALAAGAYVKHDSWRWSYYMDAILFAICSILVLCTYFPTPTGLRRQGKERRELLMKFDYFGIFLFAGSIASLVIGLTWGGTTYPWNSGRIIGALVVGCAGLVCFGLYEWLAVTEGILDHRLFQSRNFPILLLVCVIDGMLLIGLQVLWSQQVATMFTQDPIKISVALVPLLATTGFACFPAGWVMARTKSYRVLLIGALLWCSLFTGLMALLNSSRLSWAYTFTALFGIGTAVTTVIPIVALILSVPSFLLGTAGTVSGSCRALGGIIGITIFTAIYNNKIGPALGSNLGAVLGPAGDAPLIPDVIQALVHGQPLATIPNLSPELLPALYAGAARAQASSWKFVWIAISVIILANAILCCFLKSVRERMNGHIESALEHTVVREEQMAAVKH